MTYQVVASHRTGSTLLNWFCINDNDGLGFPEFFLDPSYTHLSYIDKMSIEEKFEFLEYYKNKDVHFSTKIFPRRIIKQGYESRLKNYLDGYKILTIKRDPFDSFLSNQYQDSTDWKYAHRNNDSLSLPLKDFEIDLDKIKTFQKRWKTDHGFIEQLDVYKRFDYDDLTVSNLQRYFKTDYDPNLRPININYRKLIINFDEVKEVFDNEMYSS